MALLFIPMVFSIALEVALCEAVASLLKDFIEGKYI